MPVSIARVLSCFSAGLLVLHLIVLSGHAKLEQCKAEQAEVDLERHLTIHYSLCDDPGSVCFQQQNEPCEPEQDSEEIIEAKLVDQTGNSHGLKVQDNGKEFDVLLPEEQKINTGIFHYNITYQYEAECTYPFSRGCTGWVKDLRLSVTIVDYTLNLSSNNDMDILDTSANDEMQIQSDRNISLLCSSGLGDVFSSLHIPATFFFYPKHDTDNYNVSSICDSDDTVSVNNGKWIITRQQLPPHDCVLTIVEFSEHDVGKYCCAGLLSQSSSPSWQVEDWSNHLHLKLLTKLYSASGINLYSLGFWATAFFGMMVTAIVAIFLAFVVVVGYSAYRHHRSTRQPDFQVLPRFEDYGSISTLNNDLSRPHTPNPNGHDEIQQLVVYWTSDHDTTSGVSEIESSFDERRPSSRVRQKPKRKVRVEVHESDHEQPEPPPQELLSSEPPSSGLQPSIGQEGMNAYMEHIHIQPAEGETPKDSTAPPNPNYRCPICHKTYHDDQRLFWKRHWNERNKRCTPCSQESAAFGTGIAKPSERESETFQSEEPSGASVVNGLQVNSLADSTKSVGEQGREIYDQYMDLQPAIGETPKDSPAPLNPNYRCPNCKRTYHDDQRTFYARHWNEREKRCFACTQDQPNATVTHENTTVPLSGATGDLPTQPTICVAPPTLVDQMPPTAAATESKVDRSDLTFMSESDRSSPLSSRSTSNLDSMNI